MAAHIVTSDCVKQHILFACSDTDVPLSDECLTAMMDKTPSMTLPVRYCFIKNSKKLRDSGLAICGTVRWKL